MAQDLCWAGYQVLLKDCTKMNEKTASMQCKKSQEDFGIQNLGNLYVQRYMLLLAEIFPNKCIEI